MIKILSIDLNCDMGESFGNYRLGNDEEILKYVTSVNIACGFHAGDPVVMENTVKMAIEKGVSIGAHPGYLDLIGFGRRRIELSLDEARAYMIYQIGALKAFVESHGGKLQHVKPHGALYNTASTDYELSRKLAEAIYDVDKELIFVGLSNSKMIKAGKDVGLNVVNEVFADRSYNSDGTLVSRKIKGSIIENTEECLSRAINMVKDGVVETIDGNKIKIMADTICLHGDNETALELAKNLNQRLSEKNIKIKSLRDRIKNI